VLQHVSASAVLVVEIANRLLSTQVLANLEDSFVHLKIKYSYIIFNVNCKCLYFEHLDPKSSEATMFVFIHIVRNGMKPSFILVILVIPVKYSGLIAIDFEFQL
jgi:hypothetical protein